MRNTTQQLHNFTNSPTITPPTTRHPKAITITYIIILYILPTQLVQFFMGATADHPYQYCQK
ncbi:hypothetical protein [Saccharicrinis fermentans]|uniref:hypothetical protein n=1 Tax=Saccharicrinis fermentans TaxID=982 RepID=UPI0004BA153A|nr:hypothetical protein [Saccharicrinis fermentans]